jgi:predicted DNA-binding helix-hairpin-helix protein
MRRLTRLTLADVARITRGLKAVKPFIVTADWLPVALADQANLRPALIANDPQLSLF